MLSPRKAAQAAKLYLTHWLKSQENRRRIQEVLDDELKPFFGLHGTVYLIAHSHSHPIENQRLVENIESNNKTGILSYTHSKKFKHQVEMYRDDVHSIATIIKWGNVKTIYVEQIDKDVVAYLKWLEEGYEEFGTYLTTLWMTAQSVDDTQLYMLWPAVYMRAKKQLWDIEIKGMEGESKNIAEELVHEYSKATNMVELTEVIWKLDSVSAQRDREMGENIVKGWRATSIAIFGGNHHNGIQEMLRKNKYRTKSKYSTVDKDMLWYR